MTTPVEDRIGRIGVDCPGCNPEGHSECKAPGHWTCAEHVCLVIEVDNCYVDGYRQTDTLTVYVERPEQGLSEDDLHDWAGEHLMEYTGTDTGRENVDAYYTVTVLRSWAPYLVPVGSTFEWGG